jgi:hypothetical protein
MTEVEANESQLDSLLSTLKCSKGINSFGLLSHANDLGNRLKDVKKKLQIASA